jgi:hypothetical protein
MNKYLEEAAEQYRKVLAEYENAWRAHPSVLSQNRLEIADKLAALGAIEAGVIPAALLRDLLDRIPEVRKEED